MDNVRGVCGCPVAGLTPHELFDASPVVREFTDLILDNKEFTNLPRKFNVTITGCLENCCHAETQDIGLVPAYRELDGPAGQRLQRRWSAASKAPAATARPRRWTCSSGRRRRRGCAADDHRASSATTAPAKRATAPGWRS